MSNLPKAIIQSMGSYVPKKVLSNFDLEKMVDTTNEWIITRTGIRERRIAAVDETTANMGLNAAKVALLRAQLKPEDIDLILVATTTPDYPCPSTACLIQEALGAKQAAALDIQAACTGYLYGLSLAKAYIESGTYGKILLIASEKISAAINYKDRNTCILFGDGASASVISRDVKGLWLQKLCLGADGRQADMLFVPAGGTKLPTSQKTLDDNLHYFSMNGKEVFKHAVRRMEKASHEVLQKCQLQEKDISWIVPHQANVRILDAISERFQIDSNRVYKTVHKYANTSASSVPIALDELSQEETFNEGENLLLIAFGAGFTWGSAILTQQNL